jgi:hypothetical protein
VVNAIFYLLQVGCQMLPRDYGSFRASIDRGDHR